MKEIIRTRVTRIYTPGELAQALGWNLPADAEVTVEVNGQYAVVRATIESEEVDSE